MDSRMGGRRQAQEKYQECVWGTQDTHTDVRVANPSQP